MENKTSKAFVIVDAQRGFMPAHEGDRLRMDGFGALGVEGGEKIIAPLNRLTVAFGRIGAAITTTQDFHPAETAHFSETPNFVDTWPVHCVGGTPGAELHPDLLVEHQPGHATRFIKGDVACESPADDTSYTGALAHNPETGVLLPDWLQQHGARDIYVAGLALGDGDENKLCVDSTAVDLIDQGFDVTLITDATEAVMADNKQLCLRRLGERGIRLLTTAQAIEEIEEVEKAQL